MSAGYCLHDIARFTLGELICRTHAVVYLNEMAKLEDRVRLIQEWVFVEKEERESALRDVRNEVRALNKGYDDIALEW